MNTYPAMNAKIVFLLRLREDPTSLYAAARIEELEKALDRACKCLSITDCLSTMGRRNCDGECVACWKKYLLEVSNDA